MGAVVMTVGLAAILLVFWLLGAFPNSYSPSRSLIEIIEYWSIAFAIILGVLVVASLAFYPKMYYKLLFFLNPKHVQFCIHILLNILFYLYAYFFIRQLINVTFN